MASDTHVALTKCFYCGGPGDIMLATKYRQDGSSVVNVKEKFHGKVAHMQPCSSCAKYMKLGVILISVRDGEMDKLKAEMARDPGQLPNPYRTGRFSVVREQYARKRFTPDCDVFKSRWAFVEDTLWEQLGLPTANEDHTHPNEVNGPTGVCHKCGTRRNLDPTWAEHNHHGKTIRARCLTCNPETEADKDQPVKLVPHTILLYADKSFDKFGQKTENKESEETPSNGE